jgi:perosamine synthetase
VQAAIGLAQMERIDQLVADRKRVGGWYNERLQDVAGLTLPPRTERAENVFWLYSVLARDKMTRDQLMDDLSDESIETRPFFYPIHTFPMYRNCRADNGCPVASDLSARGLNLPTSSYLQENDIEVIAGAVRTRLTALEARKGHGLRPPPKSRAA